MVVGFRPFAAVAAPHDVGTQRCVPVTFVCLFVCLIHRRRRRRRRLWAESKPVPERGAGGT
ncbi:hypothetical protein LY76DRAFT_594783 [Colletotrichum caudatum]|nr:hypothetical protein LY76DRAFT_594783 [Colletotrichum caudatum]